MLPPWCVCVCVVFVIHSSVLCVPPLFLSDFSNAMDRPNYRVEQLEASWAECERPPYVRTDLVSLLAASQQCVQSYIATHEEEVKCLRHGQLTSEQQPQHDRPPCEDKDADGDGDGEAAGGPSSASSSSPSPPALNDPGWESLFSSVVKIQAPMVRCSRPAFRKLCRVWGTDVSYTHMILADSFSRSAQARHCDFATYVGEDRLVVQLAAKSAPAAATAAVLLAPYCDAIDLNCGCPQKWAMQEGVGAALLEKPELVADMVRAVHNSCPGLLLPCVVKMRVYDDVRRSVDFARQCEAAGASWLTVHGRTPFSTPNARVQWESIRLVQDSVEVPVVANGDVASPSSAVATALGCGVGAVMAANGLLQNPAAFFLPKSGKELGRECTFMPSGRTVLRTALLGEDGEQDCLLDSARPQPPGSGAWPGCAQRLWSLPATPLEVLSDFVRAAVATDLAFPAVVSHVLRMSRAYLSPTERTYVSALHSTVSVLAVLQELGLYTDRGRIHYA